MFARSGVQGVFALNLRAKESFISALPDVPTLTSTGKKEEGKMEVKEIRLDSIYIPYEHLPRIQTGTMEEFIRRYQEVLEDGGELDPIAVWERDGKYWVVDGVHRIRAHERAGRTTIKAEILSLQDEIEYEKEAVRRNLKHGAALTKEERIEAARKLYSQGVTVEELAKIFSVSKPTIYIWTQDVRQNKKVELVQKVKQLKDRGFKLEEIAKQIKKSKAEVSKILHGKRLSQDFDPSSQRAYSLYSAYIEQGVKDKDSIVDGFIEFLKARGIVFHEDEVREFMRDINESLRCEAERIAGLEGSGFDDVYEVILADTDKAYSKLTREAKQKLLGIYEDEWSEVIERRERRKEDERGLVELAKEVVGEKEFLFTTWGELGKRVFERKREKRAILNFAWTEEEISEALKKHADEILAVYREIPEEQRGGKREVTKEMVHEAYAVLLGVVKDPGLITPEKVSEYIEKRYQISDPLKVETLLVEVEEELRELGEIGDRVEERKKGGRPRGTTKANYDPEKEYERIREEILRKWRWFLSVFEQFSEDVEDFKKYVTKDLLDIVEKDYWDHPQVNVWKRQIKNVFSRDFEEFLSELADDLINRIHSKKTGFEKFLCDAITRRIAA